MTMCSKIIRETILCFVLCFICTNRTYAQFDINWGGLVSSAIDESSRTEVQKIFASLSKLNFSDAKLKPYQKAASSLGMNNPTTVEALMKFEHGIRPFEVSPFATYSEVKLNTLGNGRLFELESDMIRTREDNLLKNKLSDYLNSNALTEVSRVDEDGTFETLLMGSMNAHLALLINNHTNYIPLLKSKPNLLQNESVSIIPYIYKAGDHSNIIKSIISPIEWDYTNLNDSVLQISSQIGTIARIIFNKNKKTSSKNALRVNLDNNPTLLNYELPPSALVQFGDAAYLTDKLGRIIRVSFNPTQKSIKYPKKTKLNSKYILLARDEADQKPLLIIPKKYGGSETWSNIMAYANTKENSKAIKDINKRIDEAAKNGASTITVRIEYGNSSSKPLSIQYYCGDTLVGTIK